MVLQHELHVHNSAVTRLCMTYDNSYLFSGAVDGSFAFLQIQDRDLSRKKEAIVPIQFSIEKMYVKAEREELLRQIADMR